MSMPFHVSQLSINQQATATAQEIIQWVMKHHRDKKLRVYGIPRGGIPAAYAVSHALQWLGFESSHVELPQDADLFIDDIFDSGATALRYQTRYNKPVFVLYDKRTEKFAGKWLVMPWEQGEETGDIEDNIRRIIQYIGDDPSREGLLETPTRVAKALRERMAGYSIDPAELLKTFEDGAERVDEMVIVHNIPVISKCEHHMEDIIGVAHVGYIPDGRIIGLSKLARIVDAFARRLQVQERMTNQIADLLQSTLDPRGVGVLIRAAHHCMSTRGVKIHGSVTTTSAMRGALYAKPEARAEFLALCRDAEMKQ
jgi:GTP cyclohydrolase I